MLKISCWGYYGKDNIGDDLLLAELLKHLSIYAKDADVTVFSDKEFPNQDWFCRPVFTCPRSSKNLLKQSLASDILICGGGGLFAQRNTLKLLLWLLLAFIMRVRGKALICLGLGIGHQNFEHGLDRLLWRMIVNLSKGVVVRQKGVAEALKMKNSNKLVEAADIVFGIEDGYAESFDKTEKTIVFSLAHIFWTIGTPECEKFSEGIGAIMNDLIARGYMIHLVEFTKNSDRDLYKDILKKVQNSQRIIHHEYSANPYDVIKVFAQAQFSVCMRFHSLVLSVVTQTPACIISYSDKLDDVISRLNLGKYAICVSPIPKLYYDTVVSFEKEVFFEAITNVLNDEEVLKNRLHDAVTALQCEAEENWKRLEDVIREQEAK